MTSDKITIPSTAEASLKAQIGSGKRIWNFIQIRQETLHTYPKIYQSSRELLSRL